MKLTAKILLLLLLLLWPDLLLDTLKHYGVGIVLTLLGLSHKH